MVNREIESWMRQAAADYAVGNFRDAAESLLHVLQRDPAHAAAATQLAEIETEHGQYGNAKARLLGVLRARPRFAAAYAALSRACLLTGRMDEAIAHAREACALEPAEPRHVLQAACVMMRQGDFAGARAALQPLLALEMARPEIAGSAHGLLGEMLEAEGSDGTVPAFQNAVRLLPNDAAKHLSLGIALLRAGQFGPGWEEYGWRNRTLHLRQQALSLPDELQWQGQNLRGCTIVLQDEQGIGDAIQFFRYVPMVAARGPARLIHVAFPVLAPLFRNAMPFAEVVESLPFGTNLNWHSTTMALAGVFGTRLETVPATVPYILPDLARVAAWAPGLASLERPRVGLVWSGNPKHPNDANRSMRAAVMLPLTALPGTFFALQPEIREVDATAVAACPRLISLSSRLTDFAETAAVIASLDLVITVDTAIAHLAGAMGKPVWILLPRVADWRWLEHREDSPWYPTARLFRAGHDGWESVIARVAEALRRL